MRLLWEIFWGRALCLHPNNHSNAELSMSAPGTERTRHQYYAVASALQASQISARD